MIKKSITVLFILVILVLFSTLALAMGRKVKRTEQPPSLEVTQPEVELIKPEELPSPSPIDAELKERKPQEISVQLAPDEATKSRQIQTALKNAGFDPGPVDGKIGPKTKKAIKDFQAANGLTSDGKVGPKTWAKLSKYLLQGK